MCRVEKIIIEKGVAIGVKMVNGDKIFAKNVVSGAGLTNTFKKLLPKESVPKHILKNTPRRKPRMSKKRKTNRGGE